MELNNQSKSDKANGFVDSSDELISLEECKQYIGKFDLSDQSVFEMRNILIGVADKAIGSYLNEFI